MEVILKERPQSVTILCGFPGFGLIGSIVTEYMLDHLESRSIGSFRSNKLSPMVAIHGGKKILPIEIHYAQDYNMVIIHSIAPITGLEWEIAHAIAQVSADLTATKVISLEGVFDPTKKTTTDILKYESQDDNNLHSTKLQEGILMGVTASLALENVPLKSIFATTHSQLPDSVAASELLKVLDAYLGLKIDPEPLAKRSAEYEEKLKSLLVSSKQSFDEKQKMNYVG